MSSPNRTKIVATLGPASNDRGTIEQLVREGVDVFRLNAAHCDQKQIVTDMRLVRSVARRLKVGLGVLVDLQGPKIRVGSFKDAQPLWLHPDQELVISCEPGVIGEEAKDGGITRIGCRYPDLARDLEPGARVLLDDGIIELKVVRIDGPEILTRVVHGGLLNQHKGINLPGSKLSMESLSAKDLADLDVALEHGADFIAISFVRTADDMRMLKSRIAEAGSDAHAIAKIERPEAIDNLDEIISTCDGLMIARGDMGVEIGTEVVPVVQKRIIRLAIEARKPVITATQMLESMVTNPRPTRAEASDVANAIYDGTSAVMLSAETASGKYPVRAVSIMSRIIRHSESDLFSDWEFVRRRRFGASVTSIPLATVRAAAYAAFLTEACAVAVFTESGRTALLMSGERTLTPIYAFTPFPSTVQRLSLAWGVTAIKLTRTRTSQEMTVEGERILLERGIGNPGDKAVVVVGSSRREGNTNIMKIQTLGE